MDYEIPIPARMHVDQIADELAHEIWWELAAGGIAAKLLPVHFEAIRMELRSFLQAHRVGGRDASPDRLIRFVGAHGPHGRPFEEQLAEGILDTLGGVLRRTDAPGLIAPGLPRAIHAAFLPYGSPGEAERRDPDRIAAEMAAADLL